MTENFFSDLKVSKMCIKIEIQIPRFPSTFPYNIVKKYYMKTYASESKNDWIRYTLEIHYRSKSKPIKKKDNLREIVV